MPKPATSRSSACPPMRWTASARKPLPLAATSSLPNRSTSSLWSPPYGALLRTRNNSLPCWSGRRAARQPQRDHRALTRLALHRHIATHHARELASDGEAEPGAAVFLGRRRLGLGKFLKQLAELLRGH